MNDGKFDLQVSKYESGVQISAAPVAEPGTRAPAFPRETTRSQPSSTLIRVLSALWPPALFFMLTAIMTYPLITNMGGSIIHGVTADADVSRWDFWWFKTALLDRHTNPFYTDMLYYPYRQTSDPLNLYYHTLQPFNALLALPFLLLTSPTVGPTLGYNVLVFVHFILTGCAMFWLVRYLTGNSFAGAVSGILFDFSPFHQFHLQYGQMELMPLEWLPLFILFLHKMLYRPLGERKPLLNGALAFACLLIASLTSWYLTLYMLIMGGLLVLVRLWEGRREWRALRGPVTAVGLIVAVWLVVISPFLLATIRAASDPSFVLVSGLDYEARFSLSPQTLFTTWKDTRFDPAVWNIGSLGFTALVLGAIGAWRRGKKGLYWYLLVVVGIVLALGPYLTFSDVIGADQTTGIPLPYLLLRNLPFLSISRVPRRFIVMTNIGLDVLAGFAVVYLMDKVRKLAPRFRSLSPGLVASSAMGLLVLIPLAELITVPQPAERVFLSPFFSQVAKLPGEAIMEMPVTSHYLRDHARMINQTVHRKKIVGGYVARRVFDYYIDPDSPFYPFIALNTRPKPDILPPLSPVAVMNYYDMPYLVFYKQDDSYEQPTDKPRVQHYVESILPRSAILEDDQQIVAYRVPVTDATTLIWPGSGWYPPDSQGNQGWRWSSGKADIRVNNKSPLSLRLRFTSSTYRGEADLSLLVDGKLLKTFKISRQFADLDSGPFDLPPGEHAVVFSSDGKPVVPAETGGSPQDNRQLSFVVKNLSVK